MSAPARTPSPAQGEPHTHPCTPEAAARAVVKHLQAAGHTAYWAGGCVRDRLLGRDPRDYDIATSAVPDAVLGLFQPARHVGKAFGVVLVCVGQVWTEVATFREDSAYSDGRRPDTIRYTDAPTDARRRDFTINAMFYDPVRDCYHDFVEGRADLARRLVRCVGDPHQRFGEDHLRLLRAVRFATTLDFSLTPDTAAAIRAQAGQLTRISAERVRDELTRTLLEANRPGAALRLLHELGLLAVILPEVAALQGVEQPAEFHPEGDVLTHTCLMLDQLAERDARLVYSVLLHDVGKPPTARFADGRWRFHDHARVGARLTRTILERLRFATDDVDFIAHCVANHMTFMDVTRMRPATLRQLIGSRTFETELALHRLDCLSSHGELTHHAFLTAYREKLAQEPVLPVPWISGTDIQGLGIPRGPAVGRWKHIAYEAQLDQRFSTREDLLAWLAGQVRAG